jgi:transcriptional regulator with XRE-family HTH domain
MAAFMRAGSALRLIREERGLSIARLAELSSSGKSQLSKYENGKELPKLDSLARILDALGVEPLTLFYWADRLARSVSEADIADEMLRSAIRRDEGSRAFKELFDRALEAHRMYIEAKMEARQPGKPGPHREADK